MPRNGGQNHPFRQASDYFYLTGLKEPGSFLMILPGDAVNEIREILFIPRSDPHTNRWEGAVMTPGKATEVSGIHDIRYTDEFDRLIRDLLGNVENIYFGTPGRAMVEARVTPNESPLRDEIRQRLPHLKVHELGPAMERIRLIKEEEEIEMVKEAVRITGKAFVQILQQLKPGMQEYEIEAIMSHVFLSAGSCGHAFHPIVASGRNALVLHYSRNDGVCRDGDMLLLDFGAEWSCYASDISRTIPVSGRYSRRQRTLYDANLRVMQKAIPLMAPGNNLQDFNRQVGDLWEEEHIRLGLYKKEEARKARKRRPLWTKYYWHGTSHSIGLDVHDPYDHSISFTPGMIFSCEPGFYSEEEGMGIRLENDILITEKGPVNLSEDIPIDPDAIEVIMNKQ